MAQALADPRSPHVYLYDGVCGLCNRGVRFLLDHDRRGRFRFAALQSDVARALLARHGRSTGNLDTIWLVRDAGTPSEALLSRSRAVLFACREVGFPWRALALAAVIPTPLLDAVYDFVARRRYRLFGRHAHSVLAAPGHEARFLGGAGGEIDAADSP